MKSNEIIFDENLEMYIFSDELSTEICISLSDSLSASEEELTEEYKNKIANFINNLPNWYNEAVKSVVKRAEQIYAIEAKSKDLQLMNIFILFEQDENELYGLEFRTEFDVEHGCGLKIRGIDYKVIEIGTGEIAFVR
ncbi:hypothetical protein HQ40_07835 [Porphyromonas gulae]|uniref:DUF2262 domain-containing protein n=1 Tax=Porphyromonas gulae TaxID=111105 RepID=A0A0A2E9L1_9PORP|nr:MULTISPECIES: hypothetical protein [Bacteroidales]KGN69956.1 hypothetical protein HR09_02935 [Porphyromonas gulae]KGN74125.1 hypothetical protein HQ40_07835 [Porphyromonas gulae]KGN80893.1 hypothetical protein HR13_02680 [Porphyromonas gulae]KGN84372.1 hypothetical protein HR15_11050 [Porphyromonas gulae]KGO01893.1 hypothetical protein HQ42_09855 [Porphyromonas gulae]